MFQDSTEQWNLQTQEAYEQTFRQSMYVPFKLFITRQNGTKRTWLSPDNISQKCKILLTQIAIVIFL